VTKTLFFEHALLPSGWVKNLTLSHENGLITGLLADSEPATAERHAAALPGMPNLHSHTFQRAFAGLTETRTNPADSFWSWREQMYRFGLRMDPDDVEAVAAYAFTEMLEGGFSAVAEFHYLHHDPAGKPYSDIAELSTRIAAAAAATGIDLTLLPVFYAHSNFGGLPPNEGQRRFICKLAQFEVLFEKCRTLTAALPGAVTGIAPHSLRAVTPHELKNLINLEGNIPFHIHIAEQMKEIDDCVAWSASRPIRWLFDHANVGPNWCLIHATHANPAERHAIAKSGAVIGFCPLTEANLGDGIFHAHDYSGSFGIGTDSNVLINVAQELRQFETTQRLARQQRNVMADKTYPATATALYQRSLAGGAQALGQPGGLTIGAPANVVTFNTQILGPAAADPGTALNQAVFSARAPVVDCVWVRGNKLVTAGRHRDAGANRARFNHVVAKLR
jgi:formiminoglutamate deiminase